MAPIAAGRKTVNPYGGGTSINGTPLNGVPGAAKDRKHKRPHPRTQRRSGVWAQTTQHARPAHKKTVITTGKVRIGHGHF